MSSYRVQISENSYSAATLFQGSGRVAYAIESEQGEYNTFLYITSVEDLENYAGIPTTVALSQHFHVVKNMLLYGNDIVLQRALDLDTAYMERVGVAFTANVASSVALTATDDIKFITDFETHNISSNIVQHPTLQMEFYAKEAYDTQHLSVAMCKPDYTMTGISVWGDVTDTADGTNKFSDNINGGPRTANSEVALCVLYDDVPVEWHVVSLVDGNKSINNENNYITDYLLAKSSYIVGYAKSSIYSLVGSFQAINLANGARGNAASDGDIETAYSRFYEPDNITFDYIIDGMNKGSSVRSYINSLVERRKDCVGFIGPTYAQVVGITDNNTVVSNVIADRLAQTNSTWTCYIDNWKQTYDKYMDKQVWIPCVSDFAGNKTKVNAEQEVWTPAAGTINGLFKSVTKLAYQPTEAQQKQLIKYQINPVFNKKGKGVIVDDQYTMWSENIGAQNLNVREVLRISEQYVADVSVDYIHQFNDANTRQRWYNSVNPFFQDLLNRGAIERYEIVYDETVNTPAVINSYEFRATILITAKRPIRTIKINFFEIPNGISFTEVPVA